MDKVSGQLSNSNTGNEMGKIVAGQFRIVSCLGMGGYGTVYKAQQLTLDRQVALKILHPISAGDEYIYGRFEREAQTLSKLEHKNIVDVYSFGIEDSRRCFIAMQLLEGQTLTQLLGENQRLPWRRALNIVMQICRAAEAAHQHGIVHRDLTPRNIMVLQTPEPDLVKVLDFGLCGPLPDNLQAVQSLTQTGALIGSVHYMSPEVCQGGRADRRSDIYSIGCILYECLAGKPPLDADEVVSVMFLQTSRVPPRLRGQDGIGELPEDLERIVFKAIQKAPGDRFESAAEFEAALAAVSAGKIPECNLENVVLPPVLQESPQKRRQNITRAVLAAACLSLTVILAVFAWRARNHLANVWQPPPSAELRSAETLMDRGSYENAVPLFLHVATTRLSDVDATRLVNDLCDMAHLLFEDNRFHTEVHIARPGSPTWQVVMEAALQPGENSPDKFAMAKAHLKAAFLLSTESQLEPKFFQGLTPAQASFCAGERAYVLGWRNFHNTGDRKKADKYFDEALSHFAPTDAAQITTVWLEKAGLHFKDPPEYKRCVNQAMAYQAALMAAPDRDSFRALVELMNHTNHDYLQIPLIEQLINREHSLRMSHLIRATLYEIYSADLSKNKALYALDYLYRASIERDYLGVKTPFDSDLWTLIMDREIEQGRLFNAAAAARKLETLANGPGFEVWKFQGTHVKFLAADGIRRIGKTADAKERMLKLLPELKSSMEFTRSNVETWHNEDWIDKYKTACHDLVDALRYLESEAEARMVSDQEAQTLRRYTAKP